MWKKVVAEWWKRSLSNCWHFSVGRGEVRRPLNRHRTWLLIIVWFILCCGLPEICGLETISHEYDIFFPCLAPNHFLYPNKMAIWTCKLSTAVFLSAHSCHVENCLGNIAFLVSLMTVWGCQCLKWGSPRHGAVSVLRVFNNSPELWLNRLCLFPLPFHRLLLCWCTVLSNLLES